MSDDPDPAADGSEDPPAAAGGDDGRDRGFDVREVLPADAIPSVDDPSFVPVGEATGVPGTDLGDDAEVIVVEAGRSKASAGASEHTARAYPIRVLHFHEVVNDVVGAPAGGSDDGAPGTDGGRPVAVTWCPLCAAAVVYDRRVDGRTLTFGVSGDLAADDLVLYDRETGSEWKQSLGEAIAGPLAGAALDAVPASTTTLAGVAAAHPDGAVLVPPGGESEAAGPGDEPAPVDYDRDPYADYLASDAVGLDAHRGTGPGRTWTRTDVAAKERVLGLVVDGDALGVPRGVVAAAGGVVRPTVGGREALVVADADGRLHAYASPGPDAEVRVTDAGGERALVVGGARIDPSTGRPRRRSGGAEADPGLDRLPARRLFAFAWQDDRGPDAFYLGDADDRDPDG